MIPAHDRRRFLTHVRKGGRRDCWTWTAATLPNGYGRFGTVFADWLAHRFAYAAFVGPIPPGHLVCHKCDNVACVRPSHLFAGSQKANMADMRSKGRWVYGNAKLTRAKVRRIKSLLRIGVQGTVIGRRFGVHLATISCIKVGKSWADV